METVPKYMLDPSLMFFNCVRINTTAALYLESAQKEIPARAPEPQHTCCIKTNNSSYLENYYPF